MPLLGKVATGLQVLRVLRGRRRCLRGARRPRPGPPGGPGCAPPSIGEGRALQAHRDGSLRAQAPGCPSRTGRRRVPPFTREGTGGWREGRAGHFTAALDAVGVAQQTRGTRAYLRLARVMASLGWSAVRVRGRRIGQRSRCPRLRNVDGAGLAGYAGKHCLAVRAGVVDRGQRMSGRQSGDLIALDRKKGRGRPGARRPSARQGLQKPVQFRSTCLHSRSVVAPRGYGPQSLLPSFRPRHWHRPD
jgi:hypothetical protein